MKKAAVRLKYVEAKVKLKKQLEEEEKLEKIRRDKVKDANREFESANRERQDRKGSSGKHPFFVLWMMIYELELANEIRRAW